MFFYEFYENFHNTNFVENFRKAASVTKFGIVYEWTTDFHNKNIENIQIIRSRKCKYAISGQN